MAAQFIDEIDSRLGPRIIRRISPAAAGLIGKSTCIGSFPRRGSDDPEVVDPDLDRLRAVLRLRAQGEVERIGRRVEEGPAFLVVERRNRGSRNHDLPPLRAFDGHRLRPEEVIRALPDPGPSVVDVPGLEEDRTLASFDHHLHAVDDAGQGGMEEHGALGPDLPALAPFLLLVLRLFLRLRRDGQGERVLRSPFPALHDAGRRRNHGARFVPAEGLRLFEVEEDAAVAGALEDHVPDDAGPGPRRIEEGDLHVDRPARLLAVQFLQRHLGRDEPLRGRSQVRGLRPDHLAPGIAREETQLAPLELRPQAVPHADRE
jgi:hypothetical protein